MPPQIITATADASGTAVATLSGSVGVSIVVEQISVSNTAGVGTAEVFLDNVFLCGSSQGWLDSADGPPAIPLDQAASLSVKWFGVPAGTGCVAMFLGVQHS